MNFIDYKEAEPLYVIQRAIQIYEQKLGTEHPTSQIALSWLQVIKEKGGKEKEKKRGFGFPTRF